METNKINKNARVLGVCVVSILISKKDVEFYHEDVVGSNKSG